MKFKIIPVLLLTVMSGFSSRLFSQSKNLSFYEIKVYHLANQEQEAIVDDYLKSAFLPALNRNGVKAVGVFKPIGNDTLQDRRIYVLIPFKSAQQFADMGDRLEKDQQHAESGKLYLDAAYNKAPYKRMESIFIKAFANMPNLQIPALKNEPQKRVYELRSYEGPTEKGYLRKVHMFNQGGEISLFKRLGFNAVFYGSVISGSRMPNLMYMTSFEDIASREKHWDAFRTDAEWKKLSAMDFYKNTVSKSDIILLHPTEYSGI